MPYVLAVFQIRTPAGMQDLPDEMAQKVFSYLQPLEFAGFASSCRRFNELSLTVSYLNIDFHTERSGDHTAQYRTCIKARLGNHVQAICWISTRANFEILYEELLPLVQNLKHLFIRVPYIEEEELRRLVQLAPKLRTLDLARVVMVDIFTPVCHLNLLSKLCLPKQANDEVSGRKLLEAMKENSVRLSCLALPAGLSQQTTLDILRQSAETLESLELRFFREVPRPQFLDSLKMCKRLKYLVFHFMGEEPDYSMFVGKFDGMGLVGLHFTR
jgi:hypothetical protein